VASRRAPQHNATHSSTAADKVQLATTQFIAKTGMRFLQASGLTACTASHCNTMQHTTTHCNLRQLTATIGMLLLQEGGLAACTATHCNTL